MESEQVSRLLQEVNTGDPSAFESLVLLAYGELKRMAASLMRGQINGHTLQPTALVNEAYIRLVQGDSRWDSKAHFFGAAARAMRQVLVAHARQKSAKKRAGGAARVTFHDLAIESAEPDLDLMLLDEAMTALARVDERLSRVMELRYFAGSSLPEIAELTGRSLATVKRDWTYARAWLYEYMSGGESASAGAACPA
jgi:RNA polymerase sigma factor (TIGR02999 family)